MRNFIFLITILVVFDCQLIRGNENESAGNEQFEIRGDGLKGPNVCTRIESYNVTVLVEDMEPYLEQQFVWCAQIPPRCRKNIIKIRYVKRTETVEKTRPTRVLRGLHRKQQQNCLRCRHCLKYLYIDAQYTKLLLKIYSLSTGIKLY